MQMKKPTQLKSLNLITIHKDTDKFFLDFHSLLSFVNLAINIPPVPLDL